MLFLTHLLSGILVAIIAKPFFSGGVYFFFFLFVLLGSLLPDIDERNSKINQWTGILGKFISFFAKHRGFFHSLIFMALITLTTQYFLGTYYAWGLLLGLATHIVGDVVTKQGLNLLYPFSKMKARGPLRTGGKGEHAIRVIIVSIIILELFF